MANQPRGEGPRQVSRRFQWTRVGVVAAAACGVAFGVACAAGGEGEPSITLMETVAASLSAREDSVSAVRGYFACHLRRSETYAAALRRMREQLGGGKPPASGEARGGADQSGVCAAGFVATDGRCRIDGITLDPCGLNVWGLDGPFSVAGLSVDAQNGRWAEGYGRVLYPRTVHIWDGERKTTYSEVLGEQTVRPQVQSTKATRWRPLDEVLFGALTTSSLAGEVANGWAQSKAPAEPRHTWRYLGVAEVAGTKAILLEDTVAVAGSPAPVVKVFWIAPSLAYAPLRVELMYGGDVKPFGGGGSLWVGEDQRDVGGGVILPTRVRREEWRLRRDGGVEWAETHITQFFGLGTNEDARPTDFLFVGPPLGTKLREDLSTTEQWEREARAKAFLTARSWAASVPRVGGDPAFAERLRAYSERYCPKPGGGAPPPGAAPPTT